MAATGFLRYIKAKCFLYVHVFSTSLMWMTLLTLTPGRVSGLDCVRLPPIPSRSAFSLSGGFRAILTCPRDHQDIALNTPGQGILFCDPHSPFNFDLKRIHRPVCNPRIVPKEIQVSVRLNFLVPACQGGTADTIKAAIRRVLDQKFLSMEAPCGAGQTECRPNLSVACANNTAVSTSKFRFHLEAIYSLRTRYLPTRGNAFYRQVVEKLRQRAGFTYQEWPDSLDLPEGSPWAVNNTKLIQRAIISWTGTCEEHANTRGTNLELDGVLTCRGCPRKYVLRPGGCEPCEFNAYTRDPFQSHCEVCPPERYWKNRDDMIDLCYTRP